jgi:hypothetical protein
MADALADSGIERLTSVNWQAKDRWGDTPLQVHCVCLLQGGGGSSYKLHRLLNFQQRWLMGQDVFFV